MIIDSSALLAIVLDEPDAARYAQAIAATSRRRMPSITWFEASMRIDQAGDDFAASRFDDFIRDFAIEIIPFTADHARAARTARKLYGKPRHPAQLNFGDCAAYGVARHEREPLLFKGADFAQTDIEPALKD
jgi:ribonuclease VapC